MNSIAFVNGEFLPIEEANVIHVEDRGYQFGDGVYEVVVTYQGKPFALEDHLNRYFNSARLIRINSKYERGELVKIVNEAVQRSQVARSGYEALIYFQLTRGGGPRIHSFPGEGQSVFSLTVRPFPPFPQGFWDRGVAVMFVKDIRWGACNIKSLNLLPNVLARQEAKENNCFEAVLHRDGYVTEGASTNVFMVKNGELFTAPLSNEILPGVTRMHICSLAGDLGIRVNQRSFSVDELFRSDEAFLTGTSLEVLAIGTVDGKVIGQGEVGPITRKLQQEYKQWIKGNI